MRRPLLLLLASSALAALAWRTLGPRPEPPAWLGYADADYVRVAPTQAGRLTSLLVARGDGVAAGAPLFTQDDTPERAARDQAQAELAQARERLADLKAAGRETEIVQARENVADLREAATRVARDLARNEALLPSGASTRQAVDQLRADTASARARLRAAEARLALTADSSGRAHAIAAQEQAVASSAAALAQAEWRLGERRVAAPVGARVSDTMARPGEMLAAGTPVLSLLAPGNIFARFYVPEPDLARLRLGGRVRLGCDSCGGDLAARISYVAPQPEYTPPVIYSEGARAALVYLIEARPEPAEAARLKPGQPLSVRLAGEPQ